MTYLIFVAIPCLVLLAAIWAWERRRNANPHPSAERHRKERQPSQIIAFFLLGFAYNYIAIVFFHIYLVWFFDLRAERINSDSEIIMLVYPQVAFMLCFNFLALQAYFPWTRGRGHADPTYPELSWAELIAITVFLVVQAGLAMIAGTQSIAVPGREPSGYGVFMMVVLFGGALLQGVSSGIGFAIGWIVDGATSKRPTSRQIAATLTVSVVASFLVWPLLELYRH